MTAESRRYRALPAALVGFALAGGLVVLGAQQPAQPPPDQQRPTFRAGANLVRVDVTVIDRHGNPVTDLGKDDFEVREDNALQTIEAFKLVEASGQPAPDDDQSLPIRSPEHAAAEAARDDIRLFVIFWDEYHIDRMEPAYVGREALTDLMRNAFGPTDLVALTDPLTPSDAIRFSRDRRALADQAHQLKGRRGLYLPPRSPMEEAQLEGGGDVETLRAQVTASALEATVLFLRSIKEGRKSILFVSQDIGPIGGRGPDGLSERYHWLDKVVRLANDSNTAIYTLDPRGLIGQMSDVLRGLADGTGGKAIQNNSPVNMMRQMVKEASAFYLLGYPSQAPADGKFHRIKVRVNRPGVEVRARSGYLAPSLTELESARKAATVAEVPPEVSHALTPLTVRPESAGDLWIGTAQGSDGSPRMTVAWAPRTSAENDGKAEPPRQIAIVATAADGHVYFDGPLEGPSASFAVAAGPVKIRRTVLDRDGAAGDRQDLEVNVPDFQKTALAIGTPIVRRARTGVELNALRAAANPVPYAGHEFERTDRMLVRFSLLGAAAADSTVTASLLSKAGASLATLPFRPVPGQSGTYEIELPLASVARGDYLMAIEASHGADHAKALVAFRAL